MDDKEIKATIEGHNKAVAQARYAAFHSAQLGGHQHLYVNKDDMVNSMDEREEEVQVDLETVTHYAAKLLASLPSWHETLPTHTAQTPLRLAKMLLEMTTREKFNFTTFKNDGIDEMVTLGPIQFHTLCAHHIVPFYGVAYIGYVPDLLVAGLSKFARTVKYFSKGFHVQEELTRDIANFLERELVPKGVAVLMKAEHLCMAARGVQASGVITTTTSMKGVFADHSRTAKAEFMAGINGGK